MHIDIEGDLQNEIESRFPDGFCSYDLWDESYTPILSETYNERLFTDGVREYIASHDGSSPFFIYYAMPTPHWPLEDPPKMYSQCDDEQVIGERKAFCNVLMYGDELIGEIVQSLKEHNHFENTVMVFLSDNGPNPNWKGDLKLPEGFGQTLPLRGAKGSTFEGGIRTPAFVLS